MLDSTWKFTQAEYIHWLPCKIPGNCYTALFENFKIPHPYKGTNEEKLQWIDYRDWLFKTEFVLDSQFLQNQFIQLECPGLDTYCEVFINGQLAGTSNNAFRNWTFDIKKFAQLGSNELLIKIRSAARMVDSLYQNLEYKLPGGGSRVMARKPQFHFGWDFSPRFVSAGITDSICLVAWNELKFYDASVQTIAIHDSVAELKLNVRLFIQDTSSSYSLKLQLGTHEFEFPINDEPGMQTISRYFHFEKPLLWWPNGIGHPNLYETGLRIFRDEVLCFEKNWKTGIRSIELHSKSDTLGGSFYFLVNGVPVFCKGANYVPSDILQFQSVDYSVYLKTAVDCHFNMLRIWGGGKYESDAFYQACDEMGIMIWHDFMYACAMYPADNDFLLNATLEAEEQVERLSKYACIALWCGNNEISEGWHRWGWQDELPSEAIQQQWHAYESLFENILPLIVEKHSAQTNYWPSSPLYGRGDPRFTKYGDAHDWGLWHDAYTFKFIKKRIPRFMSEFGMQSMPDIETLARVIPEDNLHMDSSQVQFRQKHNRGISLIRKYIEDECPYPKDLNGLIYLNQYIQAEGMGELIKAHRLAKPYCMGSLYWQYNDCWPGISWSGMDYYGNWKAFQYKVQNVFQDVILCASVEDDRITVKAVSDLSHSDTIRCELFFQDFAGNPIFYDQWVSVIPSNAATSLYSEDIPFKDLQFSDSYYILLKWHRNGKTYSELVLLDALINLKLPDPEITISEWSPEREAYQMAITSKYLAKTVKLSSNQELHFFPNYFDINPGETIYVKCRASNAVIDKEQIKISSLYNYIR